MRNIDQPVEKDVEGIAIKQFLADLGERAAQQPDTVKATRAMMGGYIDNGTERPITSEVRLIENDLFSGEWIIPQGVEMDKRIVYVHGGGWLAGSADTHRHMVDLIATASKRPALIVNYGLAPECPFPEGLNDCNNALEWAAANGPDGQGEASSVSLIGDSCGGNLVAVMMVDAIQKGKAVPDALVMISPVTDLRPRKKQPEGIDCMVVSEEGMHAILDHYLLNGESMADPLVSPLAASAEVFSKFPPTLVQTTSDEFLRDQSIDIAKAIWETDVPVHLSVWPNMPHVFQLFPQESSQAKRAIREISEFLGEY